MTQKLGNSGGNILCRLLSFVWAIALVLLVFGVPEAAAQRLFDGRGIDTPPATVNVPYSIRLAPPETVGADGVPKLDGYRFELGEGALPVGLSLSPDGTLSGRPTELGRERFEIVVRAPDGTTSEYNVWLDVRTLEAATDPLPPLGIAAGAANVAIPWMVLADGDPEALVRSSTKVAVLPTGLVEDNKLAVDTRPPTIFGGIAYSHQILPVETNPIQHPRPSPYLFEITKGQLPQGLTLSPSGLISGTTCDDEIDDHFHLGIQITDANGNKSKFQGNQKQFHFDIEVDTEICDEVGGELVPLFMPAGDYGSAYSQQVSVFGGGSSYVYTRIGFLPDGVTFTNDGLLSGTLLQTGFFPFRVVATSLSGGDTIERDYLLRVRPVDNLLVISPPTLPNGNFGEPYSVQLSTTGGDGDYTYDMRRIDLPDGLDFDSDGRIFGTPTEIGQFNFKVEVEDGERNTGEINYVLEIEPALDPLVVTPPSIPDGTYGQVYSQTFGATGGSGGYTFDLLSGTIPQGLSLQGDGTFSGTPTETGDFTFAVEVTDSAGNTGSRSYDFSIDPVDGLLTILPLTIPGGAYGSPYSQVFIGAGGDGDYTFTLITANLPLGLEFSPEGLLAGVPTQTGSFSMDVRVVDGQGNTGTQNYTFDIVPTFGAVTILPASLPLAFYDTPFQQQLSGEGGVAPYLFDIPLGTLPTGVTMTPAGLISGSPTDVGDFNFVVTTIDSQGNTGDITYTLTVDPLEDLIEITPASIPDTNFGSAYSQTLIATGGSGGYTFSLESGALPDGIALSPTGQITGAAEETGVFTFVAKAVDDKGNSGTLEYTFEVFPVDGLIVISPPDLPDGTWGKPYNLIIGATGGTGVYTGAITSGTLPNGMTFDGSNGAFGGTPTETGDFPLTVVVTDSAGNTGTAAYNLTINPDFGVIEIAPPTVPNGSWGTAYSQQLTASGGDGTYTFDPITTSVVRVRGLPQGLSINSQGLISGTPVETGGFTFTATVSDSSGNTGDRDYVMEIAPRVDIITVTPPTLPDGTFGSAYSQTLIASGGDGTYDFSVGGGALPLGLTLSPAGELSGTPQETGSFSFDVAVVDGQGNSGGESYTLQIDTAPGIITLAPATLPSGAWGIGYAQVITASGGSGGYVFSLSSGTLPTGLTLAPGGTLSGTPQETGSFPIEVAVIDDQGNTGQQAYTLVIDTIDGLLEIAPASLPDGIYGTLYGQTLTATGGSGGYSFALTAGTLPAGVTLNASGALGGTPTETGAFNITAGVTDSQGNTGSRDYTLTVNAVSGLITLAPPAVPDGTYGTAYNQQLTASGGQDGTYVFSLSSGALPAGVTLSDTGLISGTPVDVGSFGFDVAVVDGQGNTGDATYTLTVNAATGIISIAPATIPDGTFQVAYSQTLTASGGDGSYTFTLGTGSLPTGLTLDPGGRISGTPTETGTFNIRVDVVDGLGNTGSINYGFQIASVTNLILLPATIPSGTYGSFYTQPLSTSGGVAPYSYAVTSGTLPSGMSLSGGGTLSGVPAEAGAFNITVTVTDSQNNTGTRDYTLTIDAVAGLLAIAPPTVPDGTYSSAYSQQLTASNGDGNYTFSLTSGTLPAGMTFSPAGLLSGIPLETGPFSIDVAVVDGQGNTGSANYTFSINAATGLITISPPTLPDATFGSAYGKVLTATGGSGGYAFSVVSGALPAGLTMAPDGRIGGIPTVTGTFAFTAGVEDDQGNTGQLAYSLVVNATSGVIDITPKVLPTGTWGSPYVQVLNASGGTGGYQFSLASGDLPNGMFLAPNGVLLGLPLETGNFLIEIEVTDSGGNTGREGYTLIIDPAEGIIDIDPASLAEGTYGSPYSETVTASGGAGGYVFAMSAGTLPTGVSFDPTGNFSGTPTQTGSFGITIDVIDDQGNTGSRDYTLVVNAADILTIAPTTVPNGTYGATYSQQLTATGGDGSYTFSVTLGALPAGLAINGAGLLSGTPTETGTFNFDVGVVDGQGNTGSQSYTLVIEAASGIIAINPTSLPDGTFGVSYNQVLTALGGAGGYVFSLASGTLPAGLALDLAGAIAGTPTETGAFNIQVDVVDSQGNTGSITYSFSIDTIDTLAIAPPAVPDGTFGIAYSQQLSATGGTGDYQFSVTSGALPNGLSLSQGGLISGTPVETGAFSFDVLVVDSQGNTGQINYSISVAVITTLAISPATVPDGMFQTAYSQQLSASGGDGAYTFGIAFGNLPSGVTLSPSGLISGAPNETGTFNFEVRVLDGQGNSGQQPYELIVNAVDGLIAITPPTIPDGTFGVAYNQSLVASGGVGPYQFSLGTGALPTGMNLSQGGVISGTPTQTGTFNIRVDVLDDMGNTGTISYVFDIATITTLTITPATVPDGTFGTAYSQQFSASGGAGGYQFSLASGALPDGVTLDAAGLLSGTPLETGPFSFDVAVIDSEGNRGAASYSMTISAVNGLLTIIPDELQDGVYGQSYSQVLIALGGIGQKTFSLSSGALPTGLTLDPQGLLHGVPTQTGDFVIGVDAVDAQGNTGTISYSFKISPATGLIVIQPDTLPSGLYGTAYSQQLTATGGDGSYTFTLDTGTLPNGVTLTAGGLLSGTPVETGDFNFVVDVVDGQGNTGSASYALDINAVDGLITILPVALPSGEYGTAYSQTLTATGGDGNYTFALTGGTLPTGLTLSGGGQLTGTPLQTGTFNISVGVIDTNGNTGTIGYALVIQSVTGLITLTPPSLPEATYGKAYNVTMGASGGTGVYFGQITSGTLPNGIQYIGTSGTFTGTPIQSGSFPVSVLVTDTEGNTGSISYTLVVNAVDGLLQIDPPELPDGRWNQPYSQQLLATGGDGAYTFGQPAVRDVTRELPDGLTLSPSGLISGVPSVVGTFTFTVQVVDGQGNTGSRDYTIVIQSIDGLISISPATLPDGTFGQAYTQTLSATGGDGAYQFVQSGGVLPEGVTMDANGLISGIPVDTGSFSLSVSVVDGQGNTGTASYSFKIAALDGGLVISPPVLPSATFGLPYNVVLDVTGGIGPYLGEITSGSLPDGVVLSPTNGIISGVPEETGNFPFNLRVTDSVGNTGYANYSLFVAPVDGLIEIRPETLPDGQVGIGYEIQLLASGGSGGSQFSVVEGTLPPGLTLNAAGLLSGEPTKFATYNFRVAALDSQLNSGTISYALKIANARPDPSTEQDVIDIIDNQFRNAERHTAAVTSGIARRQERLHEKMACLDPLLECHGWGFWQEANYSTSDETGYGNLMLGIDRALHENLALGVAAGYGQWHTIVGDLGSQTTGDSLLISGYFTWRLQQGLYLDGMIGSGDVTYNDRRYISDVDAVEYSRRTGDVRFATFKLTGEMPFEQFLLKPHLRFDYSKTALDAYQEGGATTHALAYGPASRSRSSLTVGATAHFDAIRRWGRIRTKLRAEIGREANSGYSQSMYYLDTPGQVFVLNSAASQSTRGSLGLGIEILAPNKKFDFEIYVSDSTGQIEPIFGLLLGAQFEF